MQKIIVTKHKAVEEYVKLKGIADINTPVYSQVSSDFVKGKHIIGIVPFNIAASCELFTEVKVTLRRGRSNIELSLEQLEAMVQQVKTYKVMEIK